MALSNAMYKRTQVNMDRQKHVHLKTTKKMKLK